MNNSRIIIGKIEQADIKLQHIWATMQFAEVAFDTVEPTDHKWNFPLHLLAILKNATADVQDELVEIASMVAMMDSETA